MPSFKKSLICLFLSSALIASSCEDTSGPEASPSEPPTVDSPLVASPIEAELPADSVDGEQPIAITQITDEETAKLEKAVKDLEAVELALGKERHPLVAFGVGITSFAAGVLALTQARHITAGVQRMSRLFEETQLLRSLAQSVEADRAALEKWGAELNTLRREYQEFKRIADLKEAAFDQLDALKTSMDQGRWNYYQAQRVKAELPAAQKAASEARQLALLAETEMNQTARVLQELSFKTKTKAFLGLHRWTRMAKNGVARIAGSRIAIGSIQAIGVLASGAIFIENYGHVLRIDALRGEQQYLASLLDSKTKKVIQQEVVVVQTESTETQSPAVEPSTESTPSNASSVLNAVEAAN